MDRVRTSNPGSRAAPSILAVTELRPVGLLALRAAASATIRFGTLIWRCLLRFTTLAGERSGRERGAALITVLLILSPVAVLGTALLTISAIEVAIARNYALDVQLLYLAEAGLEHARGYLDASAEPSSALLSRLAGADGTLSDFTRPEVLLQGDDHSYLPSDAAKRNPGQSLMDLTGRRVGRYHVFVRKDVADGRGTTIDTNGIIALLSLARIGFGRKVIELEARRGAIASLARSAHTGRTGRIFRTGGLSVIHDRRPRSARPAPSKRHRRNLAV